MIWNSKENKARAVAAELNKSRPSAMSAAYESNLEARNGRIQAYLDRTALLEAELAAIAAPADLYRIVKNFEDGSFSVERWGKRIDPGYVSTVLKEFDAIDFRSVVAGHVTIKAGLPTHKAAEGWLKAHLDPTTNRTSYDASGNRIEPSHAP